jgi:hypothetical protein
MSNISEKVLVLIHFFIENELSVLHENNNNLGSGVFVLENNRGTYIYIELFIVQHDVNKTRRKFAL